MYSCVLAVYYFYSGIGDELAFAQLEYGEDVGGVWGDADNAHPSLDQHTPAVFIPLSNPLSVFFEASVDKLKLCRK